MSRKLLIPWLVCLFLLTSSFGSQDRTSPAKFKSDFRYLIVDNFARNSPTDNYRYRIIGVLIEESAFNSDNLEKLNRLILKRFPSPENVDITVYTNLDQIMTPEEVDIYGGRESDPPITRDSHPRAFIDNSAENSRLTVRSAPRGDIVSVTNLPR